MSQITIMRTDKAMPTVMDQVKERLARRRAQTADWKARNNFMQSRGFLL